MTEPDTTSGAEPAEHLVAVLGASPKADRYSNFAVRLLKIYGYRVAPVHPAHDTIEELPVAATLADIGAPVDTLSLYLGPDNLRPLIPTIIDLAPGRVIFNPGTESPELQAALQDHGIPYVEACTLVMLRTGQFQPRTMAGR